MNLIYKVDPKGLSDTSGLGSKKKRNVFNGSSGRIIVDEMDENL
jgi:hypothetical protein